MIYEFTKPTHFLHYENKLPPRSKKCSIIETGGSVREHQMAARRPENSQRDSPADSSQRSFGPFVRELYRQNSK